MDNGPEESVDCFFGKQQSNGQGVAWLWACKSVITASIDFAESFINAIDNGEKNRSGYLNRLSMALTVYQFKRA